MNINNLKSWAPELNICIRCGYCYENCHIYKIHDWESNTPRGKMLLAFGLLNGDFEPTKEVAEKFFECFYCGLCEKSCSANVSLRDMITDIRKIMTELKLDSEGTTVSVNDDKCSGCGICVSICKSEASILDKKEENGHKIAIVDKDECQGCGVCISACPSEARQLNIGYMVSQKEMLAEITNFLKKNESTNNSPKIISFCCNWSVNPGLRLSRTKKIIDNNVKNIVTMCTGRIGIELILEALKLGAAGILISACSPGECEHDGNYKIFRRVLLLKKILARLNIEPERIKIQWIDTGEVDKLQKGIDNFYRDIKKLEEIYYRKNLG